MGSKPPKQNSREPHAQLPETTAPRKIAHPDAHLKLTPSETVPALKSIRSTLRPPNAQRKMLESKCSHLKDVPVKQLVKCLCKRILARMDTKPPKLLLEPRLNLLPLLLWLVSLSPCNEEYEGCLTVSYLKKIENI